MRELDVRAGGQMDVVMHGPDGTDFANVCVFDDVERPSRRGRELALLNWTSQRP